jgi:hypothetical protein
MPRPARSPAAIAPTRRANAAGVRKFEHDALHLEHRDRAVEIECLAVDEGQLHRDACHAVVVDPRLEELPPRVEPESLLASPVAQHLVDAPERPRHVGGAHCPARAAQGDVEGEDGVPLAHDTPLALKWIAAGPHSPVSWRS